MRAVVQRVMRGSVSIDENITGAIGMGLVVLLGVGKEDNKKDLEYIFDKIINLRIFEDMEGKMNLSLLDIAGSLLVVSQFTLYGDCRKGRRPGFDRAAPPKIAEEMYDEFIKRCRDIGVKVETGVFRANMLVEIYNDGPVTILLDSRREF